MAARIWLRKESIDNCATWVEFFLNCVSHEHSRTEHLQFSESPKGLGELDHKSFLADPGKTTFHALRAAELSSRLAEHSENGYLVLDLFQNRSHWEQ
jgi:hypothetical protein